MPVEIVHWNPLWPWFPGRIGRRVPGKRPVNNFGDLIGPMLVGRILEERHIQDSQRATATGRLLTVGSILQFAEPGDVVWGSGVNGRSPVLVDPSMLDIRAVRGPVTGEQLRADAGKVPEVYGDPGLLWARYWPRESYESPTQRAPVTIVPNFHDYRNFRSDPRAVNPRSPVHDVISRIANSDFVCGSSLHGIIIAESFGIPARLIRPGIEPPLKYDDYYSGTGRDSHKAAATVPEAVALGGEPPVRWEADALLDAFPIDLWSKQ